MFSACGCTSPQNAPVLQTSILASELNPHVAKRVDLNRDGTFDVLDVIIFEARNGLPHVLSAKFLAVQRKPRTGK